MEETAVGMRTRLPLDYADAVERTKEALKAEGFGVLTTIDVRETLKQKLDVDFRNYVILGACNPPLANRALTADLEVGLLLPCNIVVYEEGPRVSVVAAVAPLAAIGMVGKNPALTKVAIEADAKLRRVLEKLEAGA